jgi:hypothetical protein
MQVTITGFICARQYNWDLSPSFEFLCYDPSAAGFDSNAVVIQPHSMTVEIPDNFDIRPGMVDKLRQERDKVSADFAKRVKEIDDRINSLLAIENK